MDKLELKRVLHEQFVPLQQATQQKLAYLQSDEVFLDNPNILPQSKQSELSDDSLANAFMATNTPHTVSAYSQPNIDDYNRMQAAPNPQYISEQPTQQSIQTSKQNLAARIAALRGISLPGDYLRNK